MSMCADSRPLRGREGHDGVVGNGGNGLPAGPRGMTEMWELCTSYVNIAFVLYSNNAA